MLDILRLVRVVLELLANLGQPLKTVLLQPLVTVAMLVFLYAGWHVRDEGSVIAGLRVAFIDTTAYRVEHLRQLETTILQIQLRQTANTDKLIDQLLAALLARAPTAARVRLDVVHNGVTGVTGTALLRYDVTNAVAAAGHAVGPMVVNQPLSDWSEFLPTMMAGQCQVVAVQAGTGSSSLRARLEALGAGTFLACPIIDIQGRMLGGVFVTWDVRDSPPSGEALQAFMDFAKTICVQIASALDLRGYLPWPPIISETE
jgi:hypothetical protein